VYETEENSHPLDIIMFILICFVDYLSCRTRESDIIENNFLFMFPVVPVFVQSFPSK
jgi:hypothetical protein